MKTKTKLIFGKLKQKETYAENIEVDDPPKIAGRYTKNLNEMKFLEI